MSLSVEEVENRLLRKLAKEISAMFDFSGWDSDVDDDARMAVRRVRSALLDLERFKESVRAADADDVEGRVSAIDGLRGIVWCAETADAIECLEQAVPFLRVALKE